MTIYLKDKNGRVITLQELVMERFALFMAKEHDMEVLTERPKPTLVEKSND